MNLVGALFCGRCGSAEVGVELHSEHRSLEPLIDTGRTSVAVTCSVCRYHTRWVIDRSKLKITVELT